LINLRDGKVIEFTNEEIEKLQPKSPASWANKLVDHRLRAVLRSAGRREVLMVIVIPPMCNCTPGISRFRVRC